MQSNNLPYEFLLSLDRIDAIISQSNKSYQEVDSIPSRDKLTYDNGFYINCSAIFIDIRESSKLTNNHYRPTLAKLYRAYISEVTAILNSNEFCREINIIGDSVAGICDTYGKTSAEKLVDTASKVSSLTDILNCKFKESGINEIEIGIGISYGRALMIQAGYKGSNLNEVIWMGDVVNEASNLCNEAGKSGSERIRISNKFFRRLGEDYQNKFSDYYSLYSLDILEASLSDDEMQEWYNENCLSPFMRTLNKFSQILF